MTIDDDANRPGPERWSTGSKTAVLRSRDLAMMTTAARYDLAEQAERTRSVRDLAGLFFRLAKILEVDLVIEAGAKDAGSSRRAVRLLQPEQVIAFEANPFTYRRFRHLNDDIDGLDYVHLALSTEPGTVTFHVRRAGDGSPRADGQASLLRRLSEIDRGFVAVEVAATPLDSYLGDHGFERPALWVDVEGGSGQVLPGARAVLDRAVVMIIEVEDRRNWEGQWLRPEVLSYLYDRGLVPVARDFQSRYQYNVVLVREDLIDAVEGVRWALTLFHSAANGYAARSTGYAARSTPDALRRLRGRVRRMVARPGRR